MCVCLHQPRCKSAPLRQSSQGTETAPPDNLRTKNRFLEQGRDRPVHPPTEARHSKEEDMSCTLSSTPTNLCTRIHVCIKK